ncbi:MAG TPA: peptidylprolyl isomerase [Halomicronema sp.]
MNQFKRWLKTMIAAVLVVTLSLGLSAAADKRDYGLPAGNAITDGRALLRYALPLENKPVRKLQKSIEDISEQLRANRRWSAVKRDISDAQRIINKPQDLLSSVPETKKSQAESIIAEINQGLTSLLEVAEAKDKEQTWIQRSNLLLLVGDLEGLMVKDFPFQVPEEYNNLPQLLGRATVDMATDKGTITLVVDGYSAPVTAGNFVDLVQRGFYDGLEFIRSEESYAVQTGDPAGPDEGFIDPKTGKYRSIPLEILVQGETQPLYGTTFEDVGMYRAQPVLPFSAYGTVAMARPEPEPNGGSSQFFFFLFEPELTPAGLNLLDGRYAVFGYVVEGKDVLEKIKKGDKILSAKVVRGAENLIQPQNS